MSWANLNPLSMLMGNMENIQPGQVEIPLNPDEARTEVQRRAMEQIKILMQRLPIPPLASAIMPHLAQALSDEMTDEKVLAWANDLAEAAAYIKGGGEDGEPAN